MTGIEAIIVGLVMVVGGGQLEEWLEHQNYKMAVARNRSPPPNRLRWFSWILNMGEKVFKRIFSLQVTFYNCRKIEKKWASTLSLHTPLLKPYFFCFFVARFNPHHPNESATSDQRSEAAVPHHPPTNPEQVQPWEHCQFWPHLPRHCLAAGVVLAAAPNPRTRHSSTIRSPSPEQRTDLPTLAHLA